MWWFIVLPQWWFIYVHKGRPKCDCMEELGSQLPPHIFQGYMSPIRHQLYYDPIEGNTCPPMCNVGFTSAAKLFSCFCSSCHLYQPTWRNIASLMHAEPCTCNSNGAWMDELLSAAGRHLDMISLVRAAVSPVMVSRSMTRWCWLMGRHSFHLMRKKTQSM